jgi:hypothetical protein
VSDVVLGEEFEQHQRDTLTERRRRSNEENCIHGCQWLSKSVSFSLFLSPSFLSSPGGVYQPIFQRIQQQLQLQQNNIKKNLPLIQGIDIYQQAMDCQNWKGMRDEIISKIEQEQPHEPVPVIGIGHSVGGALLTIAASHRPDLFHQVILIDSPYFHYHKRIPWGIGLKFLPKSLVIELNSLIKKAKTKQDRWDSFDDAKEYLRYKNVFRDMNSEIFDSFLQHGLFLTGEAETNGSPRRVQLVYPKEAEANLMFTVQIDLPFLTNMKRESAGQYEIHPQLSGSFLYSGQYDFLTKEDIDYAKTIFPKSFSFLEYSNSHFWPFVDPKGFSEEISKLVIE